ncbi:MAG: SRPBCC domain-containing protein [Pseudonocardia sp.]|nr:SRPBCC domain-containing protein [Pseudonocardia sp.]
MSTTSGETATITLPAIQQILVTRRFRATPARVFRVWSDPESIAQWWSGQRDAGTRTSVENDFRIGGRWRYVITSDDGGEVAFHGEYRDIVDGRKIVYTEVYEMPGAATGDDSGAPLVTVTMEPDGDGTLLTLLIETVDKALRDMIMDSGMESGMHGQMEIIDELSGALA